jgi:bifunctional non-homologous end joining protein LigD
MTLKGQSTKIVMVAFDLLYLNGCDLRKLPLVERKALLKKFVDKSDVQFSESFEVEGREMLKHACKTGLEGVVSKVRDSKNSNGRSNDWVKVTRAQRETLTIAGFALDGNEWDGLHIGRRKGADLVYAGKVDHGFHKESAKLLRARLTPLIRKTQPYSKRIAHRGIWVEPELLAEIEYRAKSAEGKVRHPFFKGGRIDERSRQGDDFALPVRRVRRCTRIYRGHLPMGVMGERIQIKPSVMLQLRRSAMPRGGKAGPQKKKQRGNSCWLRAHRGR